jgi:predicted Fe-Mo cluster-binding NifX family protein
MIEENNAMKIAAVTNNGSTISAHFGRAKQYVVLTIEDGTVVHREIRDKNACNHSHGQQHHADGHEHEHHEHGHHHHHDAQAHNVAMVDAGSTPQPAAPVDNHTHAAQVIADCEIVLSRGMGRGMYHNLQKAGVRPVLTKIGDIDTAVAAYLEGSLQEYPELAH